MSASQSASPVCTRESFASTPFTLTARKAPFWLSVSARLSLFVEFKEFLDASSKPMGWLREFNCRIKEVDGDRSKANVIHFDSLISVTGR